MTDDSTAPQSHGLQPPNTVDPQSGHPPAERETAANTQNKPGQAGDAAREEEIWVGRTHWKHFAGRIVAFCVGNVAFAAAVIWTLVRFQPYDSLVAFGIISGGFTISGITVIGGIAFRILGCRYRVTSQRLFVERGILSQTVDQTELIRVDDVSLHKTFFDRMFGIGSVTVTSSELADSETVLEGILDPDKVSEAIRTNMRILRQKSLFIEHI
jgi:membrane protein YdbS with pleckstrin-like domain